MYTIPEILIIAVTATAVVAATIMSIQNHKDGKVRQKLESKKTNKSGGLLNVVISSDFSGKPFLNVLMPNGQELPGVRKCAINSDFEESAPIALVELIVDIHSIADYQPPKKVTPLEFLQEKGLIDEGNRELYIKKQDKQFRLVELLSECVTRAKIEVIKGEV